MPDTCILSTTTRVNSSIRHPVLDDAQAAIVVYAENVASGDDASDEYIRIVALLRKAGMKLFERENKGSE